MPQKPIPFGSIQQSGLEELGGASPAAMNVIVDGNGTVRRRPAIEAYLDTSTIDSDGLSGVHATHGGVLYAVGEGSPRAIYRITADGFDQVSDAADANTFLGGTRRPTFAETEMLLVIADGSDPRKLELADDSVSLLGGSPARGTHVIPNASRLLLNDLVVDRTKVNYSDIAQGTTTFANHEVWGGTGTSGFFTAEARVDPVQAIGENTGEVWVWGTTNVELHVPDPSLVYARAAVREYGMSAPYSAINVDQAFGWLDHRRRFVVSDGRDYQVISGDIQQDLDDMAVVSDCFGMRVHEGPADCLVWVFPTDGRTYAYQMGGGWSQWMGWDSTTNGWKRWPVNCHFHRPDTDVNVVGTTAGRVGQLSMGVTDDLGDLLVSRVDTGFLDRGTDRRKHCKAVRLVIRRGTVSGTTQPVAHLRYRDEPGTWSPPIEVGLGVGGDTNPVVVLRSLGVYRRRQWRLEFSGTEDWALAGVTEDYDILEQ